MVATGHHALSDYRSALAAARRSQEIEPDFPLGYLDVFYAAYHLGFHEEAEHALRRNAELTLGVTGVDWSAVMDGLRDPRAAARATTVLDDVLSGRDDVTAWFAALYLFLGHPARALDVLEDSVARRDPSAPWIHVLPEFAPLHEEPRYRRLVQRMNLVDAPASGSG